MKFWDYYSMAPFSIQSGKETSEERNVLLIVGYKNNIQIDIKGSRVLTCVASAIANSIETRKLIHSAVYLAGGTPQEEE